MVVRTAATSIDDAGATRGWAGAADVDADADGAEVDGADADGAEGDADADGAEGDADADGAEGDAPEVEGAAVFPGAAPDAGGAGAACAAAG